MTRIKLSSAQRASGSIGNFRLSLREPLEGKWRLVEAYMGNTAYNVDATNNVVYWNESGGSGNLSATVTPGWYSASTLATAVAAAMTAATTTGSTFTGAYSTTTGKIAFTSSPSTPMVFTFDTNTTNSIASLIGYSGTETDPSLGGNNVANVRPILSYNIQIDGVTGVTDSKSASYTFIVPATGENREYFTYHPHPAYVQEVVIPRTTSMAVRVVNDSSTVISLLYDWYMILEQCK